MKTGVHTLEFIIYSFYCSGNKNKRLVHLNADPMPIEVNQMSCHLFCGFCVRPIVKYRCTCIGEWGRVCLPVLLISSFSSASSGSFLLGPPASVLTKQLEIETQPPLYFRFNVFNFWICIQSIHLSAATLKFFFPPRNLISQFAIEGYVEINLQANYSPYWINRSPDCV